MNNINYDTLCLSGGGVKGFSFIGAIEYLEKIKHINMENITHYAGTSAGSIICFILSLNYSITEIKKFILDFDISKLSPELNIENLLENHGIDIGTKIMFVIMNFLKEKYDLDDITFIDHYKLTKKKLTIIGTNYTKGCEEEFNYIKTPDMMIKTAIRISISIPIIFTPVYYNNNHYIDGGVTNNFPLNYCNKETTLGFYVNFSCCNELKDIFSLSIGILNIYCDIISTKHKGDYNIIEIKNIKSEMTNFNLDKKQKQELINLGKISAEIYIKNIANKPRANIKTYNDMMTQTE